MCLAILVFGTILTLITVEKPRGNIPIKLAKYILTLLRGLP